MYKESGYYLKPEPISPLYSGKVFVLIDQRTSKVAEALAIWLKNENMATLAGQKSAGSPMLTQAIDLDNQYHITIPIAQFFDNHGKSYLNIGTEPDLIVTGEDALSFVLRKIN